MIFSSQNMMTFFGFFFPPKNALVLLTLGVFLFWSLKKKEIGSNRGSPPQTEFGLQFYTTPFKVQPVDRHVTTHFAPKTIQMDKFFGDFFFKGKRTVFAQKKSWVSPFHKFSPKKEDLWPNFISSKKSGFSLNPKPPFHYVSSNWGLGVL